MYNHCIFKGRMVRAKSTIESVVKLSSQTFVSQIAGKFFWVRKWRRYIDNFWNEFNHRNYFIWSEINFSKFPVESALISYSLIPYLLAYALLAFMFTRLTLILVLLFGSSFILTFQSPATDEGLIILFGPGSILFSITIHALGLISLPLLSSKVHVKADLSEMISPLLLSIIFIDKPFCAKKSMILSQTWSFDLSEIVAYGLSRYVPLIGVVFIAQPVKKENIISVSERAVFNLVMVKFITNVYKVSAR